MAPNVALQIAGDGGRCALRRHLYRPAPAATTGLPFSLTGFLLTLGGALLGGLILNIMPCVFPILSLKAISLAKAGGDERKVRSEAVAYTLGILLTCLALGALMLGIKAGGTQIGWAFQLQDPRVIALLLVLMVAITLNLAGLFELSVVVGRAGQGLAGRARRRLLDGRARRLRGDALLRAVHGDGDGCCAGAALVICARPFLRVSALGLASPFLAIAYVPALRRMMPRPGDWMDVFRTVMAVPMGADRARPCSGCSGASSAATMRRSASALRSLS